MCATNRVKTSFKYPPAAAAHNSCTETSAAVVKIYTHSTVLNYISNINNMDETNATRIQNN